jgi:very-short-patch-repair endonuclease
MMNLMSERARRLRREKGPAERKLWHLLRDFNRHGCQFRQQAPIGAYIADFCDHTAKLVIEVDGSQHDEPKKEAQDYRVVRFWNYEVPTNIGGVEIAIKVALGMLREDGTDEPKRGSLVPSPLERLRKKARQLARRRPSRKARSTRRSGQCAGRSVPSPLVGEGQGGGEPQASEVVIPPTPNPSPQGGGESGRSLGRWGSSNG